MFQETTGGEAFVQRVYLQDDDRVMIDLTTFFRDLARGNYASGRGLPAGSGTITGARSTEARDTSRPILEKLGFVPAARETTWVLRP